MTLSNFHQPSTTSIDIGLRWSQKVFDSCDGLQWSLMVSYDPQWSLIISYGLRWSSGSLEVSTPTPLGGWFFLIILLPVWYIPLPPPYADDRVNSSVGRQIEEQLVRNTGKGNRICKQVKNQFRKKKNCTKLQILIKVGNIS